jgi:hypothetical protein
MKEDIQMKKPLNRLDYGQFLLSSQINFTQTYFGDHQEEYTHDDLNRWMKSYKSGGNFVWEHVKGDIIFSQNGCILFDDTVLDKNYSKKIELAQRQYSGNTHGLIVGIGVVNCIYVNPELNKYWIIDYRIYAHDTDGKSKLDHAKDMFENALYIKKLLFSKVLMDSWYATSDFMTHIDRSEKVFYCPVKKNRNICIGQGYVSLEHVTFTIEESENGYECRLKGMPKDCTVKVFRMLRSTTRTELVVTNDKTPLCPEDVQNAGVLRWKVEQFHREIKQNTGIEACQCRKATAQRTHISVAMLVWIRLTKLAHETADTIYNLKKSLLGNYMRQELRSPYLKFS